VPYFVGILLPGFHAAFPLDPAMLGIGAARLAEAQSCDDESDHAARVVALVAAHDHKTIMMKISA
jgi:hypothetical protein